MKDQTALTGHTHMHISDIHTLAVRLKVLLCNVFLSLYQICLNIVDQILTSWC